MTKDNDLYLTDKEYLDLLRRALHRLGRVKEIHCGDSTFTGDKYTTTNVGLCDDSLTTKEIAMWPDEFPKRRDMKYRSQSCNGPEPHPCPLDGRLWRDDLRETEWMSGCFYKCKVFHTNITLKQIEKLYRRLIEKMSSDG
jgi:hypothetical protein